jgi:hypothetical protein
MARASKKRCNHEWRTSQTRSCPQHIKDINQLKINTMKVGTRCADAGKISAEATCKACNQENEQIQNASKQILKATTRQRHTNNLTLTVMGRGTLQSSWQAASNVGVLNPQTPRQRCRRGQEAWRWHLTQGTYKHARAHKYTTQGGTTACQLPTYTYICNVCPRCIKMLATSSLLGPVIIVAILLSSLA